jgi:hypothetical protein
MVYWPGWLVVWKVFCEDWKLVEKWFCIIFKIHKISEFWPLFHTKKTAQILAFGTFWLWLSLSQNVKCKSSQTLITTWPIKKDVKWWQYITWCFGSESYKNTSSSLFHSSNDHLCGYNREWLDTFFGVIYQFSFILINSLE